MLTNWDMRVSNNKGGKGPRSETEKRPVVSFAKNTGSFSTGRRRSQSSNSAARHTTDLSLDPISYGSLDVSKMVVGTSDDFLIDSYLELF